MLDQKTDVSGGIPVQTATEVWSERVKGHIAYSEWKAYISRRGVEHAGLFDCYMRQRAE
jgi:hypothetical protein